MARMETAISSGSLRRPEYDASLHHEYHVAYGVDVARRIAAHGDQVGQQPGTHGPDLILHVNQSRVRARRGAEGLQRPCTVVDEELELPATFTMRDYADFAST